MMKVSVDKTSSLWCSCSQLSVDKTRSRATLRLYNVFGNMKMLVQNPNMIYQQAIDSILQNLDTVTLFKAVFNNTKMFLKSI